MWPKKKPHWSEHVLFAAKGHRKIWHHFPHNTFLTNATQIKFLFNIRSCIHKLRQPYIFNNCNHHMTGLRYLKTGCIKYLSGTEIRLLPPGQEVQWPPTTWTTRRPAWPRGAPALRRGAREMNAASSWATSATTSVSVSLALRVCVPSLKDYTNSSLLFKCTRVLSGVDR